MTSVILKITCIIFVRNLVDKSPHYTFGSFFLDLSKIELNIMSEIMPTLLLAAHVTVLLISRLGLQRKPYETTSTLLI